MNKLIILNIAGQYKLVLYAFDVEKLAVLFSEYTLDLVYKVNGDLLMSTNMNIEEIAQHITAIDLNEAKNVD